MYRDVKHADDCKGLNLINPEMRDCTCGRIIDCLLAEREHLQVTLDHERCNAEQSEKITRKKRCGFRSKTQLPLFMIWEEIWQGNEIVHAKVLFNSIAWIGV